MLCESSSGPHTRPTLLRRRTPSLAIAARIARPPPAGPPPSSSACVAAATCCVLTGGASTERTADDIRVKAHTVSCTLRVRTPPACTGAGSSGRTQPRSSSPLSPGRCARRKTSGMPPRPCRCLALSVDPLQTCTWCPARCALSPPCPAPWCPRWRRCHDNSSLRSLQDTSPAAAPCWSSVGHRLHIWYLAPAPGRRGPAGTPPLRLTHWLGFLCAHGCTVARGLCAHCSTASAP